MKNVLGELYLGRKIRNTDWGGSENSYLEMRDSKIYFVSEGYYKDGKPAMGEMNRPNGEWYVVEDTKEMTIADIEAALGHPVKVIK